MKKLFSVLLVSLGLIGILAGNILAGENCHYANGVLGIKAASLPPPGFYWALYNSFYNADRLNDKDGNKLGLGFDLSVYALVNRFLWVSNKKILGADFAGDFLIPFVYTDIEMKALGVKDDQWGLGDIIVEPFILAWHKPRYDAAFGLSIFAPTGKYNKLRAASPGRDMWTQMSTLGGTYYFDTEKIWSVSILSRYEIHSKKDKSDVRLGNDFHLEWGIGKTLAKVWDVGLTGYSQWQVTDDHGSDVTWNKDDHDSVHAIGPEIGGFIPIAKVLFSLRTHWEFSAKDHAQGNMTTLTLIKIF